MLTLITQAEDKTTTAEKLAALLADSSFFWLDLLTPTADEFDLLRSVFHFHPLAIEDATRPHQRPKVDEYEGYFFLTADETTYDPGAEESLISRQIAMFVGAHYFVTVNTAGTESIAALQKRCNQHPEILERSTGYFAYAVLDELVDRYFPLLDQLDNEINELEDRVVQAPTPDEIQAIFHTKKTLSQLRRLVGPLREVTQTLTTRDFPLIAPQTIPYLRDVSDHLFRVYETLDSYRDQMSNLLDAYLSQVNNQMSRVMQRLTAVATVFMPITFLTGVFGMNFTHQPWANTNVWWWLGLMAVIAGGMVLWLRRHRWF